MEPIAHDWLTLMALVFMLGLRHGLDADHLVVIDGLARFNMHVNRRISRWCGFLFSLGHGVVVLAIALVAGLATHHWLVPEWIEHTGVWISIFFLFALGVLNLLMVLRTAPDQVVRAVGMRSHLFGRLQKTSHPALIMLIGSLFALSLDTVSQAALFAVTATQFGDWTNILALGLLFTLGMIIADGCNGLWINRLICRADRTARVTSRVFSLIVAGLSILTGVFGVVRTFSPGVSVIFDGHELMLGCSILAVIAFSYLYTMRLARVPVAGFPR
jgi:high-affinity nickel-transport protein